MSVVGARDFAPMCQNLRYQNVIIDFEKHPLELVLCISIRYTEVVREREVM
jgi:hypothetical protein